MPVMVDNERVYSRVGYTNTWDVNRATTAVTGPWEHFKTLLTGVSSVDSPPGKRLINPHTYTKFKVFNHGTTESQSGYAYTHPMGYNALSYLRISAIGLFSNPYSGSLVLDPNWAGLEGRCLEKVLEKARGAHANLSVDFAEGMQTLAMLRKATKLRKLVFEFARDVVKHRGYKKIRPGPTQGQRRLDYVNSKWLEYRYGWMPLVHSIYDLVDALRKQRVSSWVYLEGRSGRKEQRIDIVGSTSSISNPRKRLKVDGSYRAKLGANFSLPTGYEFSDFTSLNPLLIAWELVPFSFIADWFVGIGQCLENWENYYLYRNRFMGGFMTRSAKEERTASSGYSVSTGIVYTHQGNPADQTYFQSNKGNSDCTMTMMQRRVLTSLPTPYGPRVKANLKPKQFLDIAALVGTYVRKFR